MSVFAINNHVMKCMFCETVHDRNGKNMFLSIKNLGEFLNKLKPEGFLASGVSIYAFSILYSTLYHNLIKGKLTELIVHTCKRECSLYLVCNEKRAFSILNNIKDITCDLFRKFLCSSLSFRQNL